MEIVHISDQVMGIIKESGDPAALPGYSPFEMIPAMSAGVTLKGVEGSEVMKMIKIWTQMMGGDQEQVRWHLEISSKLSKRQHLALFVDEAPAQSGFEDKGGGFSHWGRHRRGYMTSKVKLGFVQPVNSQLFWPRSVLPSPLGGSKNFNATHY